MKTIFADTFYWVALINPGDIWYNRVFSISQSLGQFKIVTTEEVITEVLTFYSGSGTRMRQRTIVLVDNILQNDTIQVIEQNHDSFLAGFSLYRSRLDKGYSLTDCISMQTMKQLKINEVLTRDRFFRTYAKAL